MVKLKTKFQKDLREAVNEADTRTAWISEIKKSIPKARIISTHNTDGILTAKIAHKDSKGVITVNDIHTLLEFKNKKGFKNKRVRCAVIMQALYYVHNIMKSGDKVPSTIFIGDDTGCFFLRTNILSTYLNDHCRPGGKPIDWLIAPSQAPVSNISLLNLMDTDTNIDRLLVIDPQSDTFNVSDILPIIDELSINAGSKIKISEDNILSAFNYFKDSVVNSSQPELVASDEKKRVSRLIDVFYNCITDRKTTMPNKDRNISTRGEVIKVYQKQYDAFFNLFEQDIYSITDKEKLVSIKDRVLEEIVRRMTGAYFTPDLWINKAYEMIAEQFGNDWREKYVVWDCASGTNNLTRRYHFKELYNSTLEQGDVDTVMDMGYIGSTFQYDFLNDNEDKLPVGLKNALTEKKPLLFLINPPYGTACSGVTHSKTEHKSAIASTVINGVMQKDKIGSCSQQLYAQFLYRILMLKKEYGLTDIKICFFSTPLFMSGEGYLEFRNVFYKHFNFKDGMLFQADQFADVSGNWGISFTVWEGKSCS